MGGPNRRYVPAIDVLKKLDNHQIWNQYHKVEILIGAIESINHITNIIENYGKSHGNLRSD